MAVKVIYFVHGTTTDNEEKKSTGWLPGTLSQKGIDQSIALKEQIDINTIDVVFSSDLKRAIESVDYTFHHCKPTYQDPRIRECNYGDLNGKPSSLVHYEDHIDVPFPNGEALKEVEARVRDFCHYLLENFDGKTVALVCHKAPQFAFEVITQNKSWEQAIAEDWRLKKEWKPGWIYMVEAI